MRRGCDDAGESNLSFRCICRNAAEFQKRVVSLEVVLCPTLNKKMRDETLHTGSLHTLHLSHTCWDEMRAMAPEGGPLQEALRANTCVCAVDKHLSPICSLNPGQSRI